MQGAPANSAHATSDGSGCASIRNHPRKGEPGYLTWHTNFIVVLAIGFLFIKLTVGKIWEKKSTDWATRGRPPS